MTPTDWPVVLVMVVLISFCSVIFFWSWGWVFNDIFGWRFGIFSWPVRRTTSFGFEAEEVKRVTTPEEVADVLHAWFAMTDEQRSEALYQRRQQQLNRDQVGELPEEHVSGSPDA